MINKINFSAKNLTPNAGLFLLLENVKANGIFDYIFVAAKITKSARMVIMNVSEKYKIHIHSRSSGGVVDKVGIP